MPVTTFGLPESDNWQETMPIWAHQVWWDLRRQFPKLRKLRIIAYEALDDCGYIVVEGAQIFVSKSGASW